MAQATVVIDANGRLFVPVELRRELGITPGTALVVYAEEGRLVLEDRARLLARRQDEVSARVPKGTSLVAQLQADRRKDAAGEGGEMLGNQVQSDPGSA